MRSVGSKDTGPEIALRRALWRRGVRYRLHMKVAGTRPDIVFAKRRLAVFVDGCFWHGCPRHYALPKSNVPFWEEKLTRNMERDMRDRSRLEEAGWRVCRVWQCEIEEDVGTVAERILQELRAPAFGNANLTA